MRWFLEDNVNEQEVYDLLDFLFKKYNDWVSAWMSSKFFIRPPKKDPHDISGEPSIPQGDGP